MPSFNQVTLAGHLTRAPELRYTPGGSAVADTAIAVNRKFKDAAGVTQEDVMFIDVTIWKSQAENAARYLDKGSAVLVSGTLKLERWESKDGPRQKHKINAFHVEYLSAPKEKKSTPPEPTPAASGDVPF